MKYYLFILLFLFSQGIAKTLYVNGSTGNDVTTYASNDSENPWLTIGRACWGSTNRGSQVSGEAAQAGDSVVIAAGTYNAAAASGLRYEPAFETVNNGTQSNPIVFYGDGTVTLQSTNGTGPVIGVSYGKNAITWNNFYIDETNVNTQSDTGPVVLFGGNNGTLKNIEINGIGYPSWNDNHTGIRIEDHDTATVINCKIYDFYCNVVNGNNGSGIMIYTGGYHIIRNNEIYNTGCGIFVKGPQSAVDDYWIYKNYIHDTEYTGIGQYASPNTADAPCRIYQNLIIDCWDAIKLQPLDGGSNDPKNSRVVNNTIYNCGKSGLYISDNLAVNAGHVFKNNIISNSSQYMIHTIATTSNLSDTDRLDSDNNLYYTFVTAFSRIFYTQYSLAQWQGFGQDANVSSSDPLFINVSVDSFQLQGGSPALTLGRDVLDLDGDSDSTDVIPSGAYLTGNEIIGIDTTGQGAAPGGGSFSTKISNVLIIK